MFIVSSEPPSNCELWVGNHCCLNDTVKPEWKRSSSLAKATYLVSVTPAFWPKSSCCSFFIPFKVISTILSLKERKDSEYIEKFHLPASLLWSLVLSTLYFIVTYRAKSFSCSTTRGVVNIHSYFYSSQCLALKNGGEPAIFSWIVKRKEE